MRSKKTKQEVFWEGSFGDQYTGRNAEIYRLQSDTAFFARIFRSTGKINSLIEFGANRGMNLTAIRRLNPKIKLTAVEINAAAASLLKKIQGIEAYKMSIFDFSARRRSWDLVLARGVLMHLNSSKLDKAYEVLLKSSRRFICIAEYYSPYPIEVPYRGHREVLFKRDFAGELMDRFSNLSLRDYGFVYRRDPVYPLDDLTWFLLEKK